MERFHSGRFELVEIRDRHHYLSARDDIDRPGGVMGRYRDVVGLAKRRDLFQLGDAAGPGDVRHDVVGQLVLEDGHEIPLGMPALAPRNAALTFSRTCLRALIAFGWAWLLEPVDFPASSRVAAQPDGSRYVEAAMRIDKYSISGPAVSRISAVNSAASRSSLRVMLPSR